MTRRRSGLTVAVMASGSIMFLTVPAQANHGLNCPDFEFQEDAQEFFDRDRSDPEGLDRDNDRIACENLPNRPDDRPKKRPAAEPPRGGVEAGAGGMADPASPALPAAGALLGTALLGAGVIAARRRAESR